MKAVVYKGPENLALEERDVPEPAPGEVLIETKAVGICGSDVGIYYGNFKKIEPPLTIGHEGGGVVRELGEGVDWPKKGTRVAVSPLDYCGKCEYCIDARYSLCEDLKTIGMIEREGEYAEYFVAPARNCHVIPESLEWRQAALIDTLAGPVATIERRNIPVNSGVAVFGAGPAGLFFARLAKLKGAGEVYLMGHNDDRLELGRSYGADRIINTHDTDPVETILELTNGKGTETVIEAAGSEQASSQGLSSLAKGGTMMVYGIVESGPVAVSMEDIALDEYELFGIADNTHGYNQAIELIGAGEVEVEPLITHQFSLSELPDAFSRHLMRDKKEGYIKGVVEL